MLGVAVVLEDEDRRGLQHDGEVHRLEHGALVATAITAEGDGDLAIAAGLAGDGGADRDRRSATDDGVGPEHALRHVGDVHRAALALAEAVTAAVDLEHHARHIAALGDAVAMAPMGARDPVGIAQVLADADRDGFLAGIKVREPRDLAGLDLDVQSLLELADGLHLPVGAEQSVRGQRHACLLGGSVFGSGR